jgi:hypothetical protein
MKISEVIDRKSSKEFLEVPKILYRDDPFWVCPLDVEIEGIFNPENNSCFQHGEAIRWTLKNDQDQLVGRIAAFYDRRKEGHFDYPTGGAGFFECIDNQEAANMLFDTAVEWLKSKGMQAMQAPINFGENYNYWGLLVEGFLHQAYAMPYNFPYYQKLFENYGFRNYFEQNSFHKDLSEGWPERQIKFAQFAETRPGYSFEHFSYKHVDKYIHDFVTSYNNIWKGFHENYTPLKHDDVRKIIVEAKMVIDEELIWFAYYERKPVGLVIAFPDINQILAKLKNGKLNLLNKLKLFYYRKRAVTRSRVFIAGVDPEYQSAGVIAAMFYQLIKVIEKRPRHTELELSWVGDYNPRTLTLYNKFDAKQVKRHITYLYLFDPKAPFRRFDNVFEGKLYKDDQTKKS